MEGALVDIFALACGVAGWFYLFYSNAAKKLAGIESASQNTLRVRLRRICGAAMVLLGIGVYAGFTAIDERRHPGIYLSVWMGTMFLLLVIFALVAADIYLTGKIRQKTRKNPSDET